MQIKSFSFDDNKANWHLEEVTFEPLLNLLVGISGVGKTRILKSLELVSKVATTDKDYTLDGIAWKICFTHQEYEYEWELKSSLIPENPSNNLLDLIEESVEKTKITHEKIANLTTQSVICDRSSHSLLFENKEIVQKLKTNESIMTLFSEENSIIPIREAFQSLTFCDIQLEYAGYGFGSKVNLDSVKLTHFEPKTASEFKRQLTPLPVLLKAFFLHRFFQEDFSAVKQYFLNIFQVEDLKITLTREDSNNYRLFFSLKEKDTNYWIHQNQVSAGMFRTLAHLIEIYLAQEGTVIVIDEFENSLGINCMSELVNFILSCPGLQFILTSHHPYIINNIPWETWKLVKRRRGNVSIQSAKDIPQLNEGSSLDKFIQLINLPDYRKGNL